MPPRQRRAWQRMLSGRRLDLLDPTPFDIEMARSAGTASIGVSWGVHQGDELMHAGADHLVAAFDEIPTAVHGLIGRPPGGSRR